MLTQPACLPASALAPPLAGQHRSLHSAILLTGQHMKMKVRDFEERSAQEVSAPSVFARACTGAQVTLPAQRLLCCSLEAALLQLSRHGCAQTNVEQCLLQGTERAGHADALAGVNQPPQLHHVQVFYACPSLGMTELLATLSTPPIASDASAPQAKLQELMQLHEALESALSAAAGERLEQQHSYPAASRHAAADAGRDGTAEPWTAGKEARAALYGLADALLQ